MIDLENMQDGLKFVKTDKRHMNIYLTTISFSIA